jgi:4'-phosphopantetheinyl transferase EntD
VSAAPTVMERSSEVRALDALLAELVPSGATAAVRRIDLRDVAGLHTAEWVAVERAVPSRQAEFASGRALLRELIGADVAVPMAVDRRPVLPPGIAATLSHDHEYVVGALTRVPGAWLGIDIQPGGMLDATEADLVLRDDDPRVDANPAFTLKEAAYKAFSNAGGRMLDHHDIRVEVDPAGFRAVVVADDLTIHGSFDRCAERWLAVAWIAAREAAQARGPRTS